MDSLDLAYSSTEIDITTYLNNKGLKWHFLPIKKQIKKKNFIDLQIETNTILKRRKFLKTCKDT
ncbi:hypothetical protein pb186bvf_006420 [Paramecium bursaria]